MSTQFISLTVLLKEIYLSLWDTLMMPRISRGIFLLYFSKVILTKTSIACEFCGFEEGYINELAAGFLFPDYFQPEADLLNSFVSKADYRRYASITYVNLGDSCLEHVLYYDVRLPKFQCDRDLQANWVRQCKQTYYKLTRDHLICRLACESFVKLMSEDQRYDS